jgi:hypothetical protein
MCSQSHGGTEGRKNFIRDWRSYGGVSRQARKYTEVNCQLLHQYDEICEFTGRVPGLHVVIHRKRLGPKAGLGLRSSYPSALGPYELD